MRLLIDNQLPEALGRYLNEQGFDCQHVRQVGLRMASDETIWRHARENGMAIVTMDEDFAVMAAHRGEIPPQIIWVRLANPRKAVLIESIGRLLPGLRDALRQGSSIIEIR